MSARIIEIFVESDEEIPEDCVRRFQAIDISRPVTRLRYEPDDGPEDTWRVFARSTKGARGVARAAEVDDSGEGTSLLIYSTEAGIILESERDGRRIVEPFLLLTPDAVLG